MAALHTQPLLRFRERAWVSFGIFPNLNSQGNTNLDNKETAGLSPNNNPPADEVILFGNSNYTHAQFP